MEMSDVFARIAIKDATQLLAAFVKNPKSSRAQRLRLYVEALSEACLEFLEATKIETEEHHG